MTAIFAKTRHDYPSYSDLWRLAEISGFPIRTIDDIDPDSYNTYIVTPMNGEIQDLLPKWRRAGERRAQIIWWFLERLDSSPMLTDGSFDRWLPHFDQVWVSDRWMATQHGALRHVVLGSHPDLGNDPLPTTYDYTHQSYVWGRREIVHQRLRALGLREGPNGWGDERDRVLRSSICMLHVQQYPLALYTPLRFAIAAAYALPLVSESMTDPYPLEGIVEQAPLDRLHLAVQQICRDPSDRGIRLYNALCADRSFRSEIENAL